MIKKHENERTSKKVRHSVASKSKKLGEEEEKTDIYMNPHKEIHQAPTYEPSS